MCFLNLAERPSTEIASEKHGVEDETSRFRPCRQPGGNQHADLRIPLPLGVGPDVSRPFKIHNFKAWDTHWCLHTFCPSVMVDGLDCFDSNYGIWRSIVDLHQYDNISFRQMHAHAIFFPMGGHGPAIEMGDELPSFPNYKTKDDQPPFSVIAQMQHLPDGKTLVRGVSVDDAQISEVRVAGFPAQSIRDDFLQWEVELPTSMDEPVEAIAVDDAGNRELRPHRWGEGEAGSMPHSHGHGHSASHAAAHAH